MDPDAARSSISSRRKTLAETIARISSSGGEEEDIDFNTYYSGRKKRRSKGRQAPSCWSWLKQKFSCYCDVLPHYFSKIPTNERNSFNVQQLFRPGSLVGLVDKELHIIKTANLPVILIMGGPGAPIEEIVNRLSRTYNFHHVIVGDILKAEINLGTGRSEMTDKLMDRGVIIPRRFLHEMIKRNMSKAIENYGVQGFFFSDYPTTYLEANAFIKIISDVDYLMFIKFDDHTLKLNVYHQLLRQTNASRRMCKTKTELKKAVEQVILKYNKNVEQLYRLFEHRMQVVDAQLKISQVHRLIMKWTERALILHGERPSADADADEVQ